MKRGFSLIELLIVIGIIGLLMTIVLYSTVFVGKKGRDTKRIADLAQIGRFMTFGCYQPQGGVTSIDLKDLAVELIASNPQYTKYFASVPQDPRVGSGSESNYRYVVAIDGSKCAIYANLERDGETITLTDINNPTPGGGVGVFQGSSIGVNGTYIYYQYSN